MAETESQSDDRAEPPTSDNPGERAEYIERSDVGVSLTVKLKRGTGTRDQDEVIAKAKGKTLADAREDMETLREYIHELAADCRAIQPEQDDE
ncbi:hypothetical protein [Haloferax sp. KTX1]|uniref:DUF7389 domain-containing protein n=1 Tax=Haloferax sp. KTX1 TaxID=2600597 RepID=UPI0011DCCF87|nr:hypothetical protein [Haloferax sp. KTX1]